MIAQVVNGLAILIGGFVGNALRGGISERFRSILMQAMALAVMLIGLRGAVQTGDVLIVVISLAVGALLGEIINIEKRLENLPPGSAQPCQPQLRPDGVGVRRSAGPASGRGRQLPRRTA